MCPNWLPGNHLIGSLDHSTNQKAEMEFLDIILLKIWTMQQNLCWLEENLICTLVVKDFSHISKIWQTMKESRWRCQSMVILVSGTYKPWLDTNIGGSIRTFIFIPSEQKELVCILAYKAEQFQKLWHYVIPSLRNV